MLNGVPVVKVGPVHILLIEDMQLVARMTSRLLRRRGYAVDVAATGADALLAANANAYSVVLCDVGLPDVDGLELATQIGGLQDCPVVIMSGYSVRQGHERWLQKPFDVEELYSVLDEALAATLA
ncbi:MAG: CheY-like chemotaxis protein [Kiritimatiellia bacterium]|jgi:CheY-like chemotaxis protein